MKEIIVVGSLMICFSACTYMQEHPEVVQEIEKDAEQVLESVATGVVETEIARNEK